MLSETVQTSYGYRLFLMGLMIAANAYFAAIETALVSVRPSRLKQLAAEGTVGAHAAIALLNNPERMLSAGQVGLTLTSLALGWLGEETLKGLLLQVFAPVVTDATRVIISAASIAFAFLLMTFAHVVFGEVVPKNLAIEKPGRLACLLSPSLLVFARITEPFIWIIEKASIAVSRAFGISGQMMHVHSAEEIKMIVASTRTAGRLSDFESRAIEHIIDLPDYNVREVMVPRNQLVMVPVDADIDDVLEIVSESRYSRLPVYENDRENIIGIVHVKDVLEYWTRRRRDNLLRRAAPRFQLRDILRKVPVVPETRALNLVLDDLRTQNAHIAFVVDEFGNISGIVSIEDVIEQILGEIEDEFDLKFAHPPQPSEVFEIEGATPIRDLFMQYSIDLPSGDEFETLAGFLLFRLGRIPSPGDFVDHGDRRFTVLEMDFNRIARIRVSRLPEPPEQPVA